MITNHERIVLACGSGGCCPAIDVKEDGSSVLDDKDDGGDSRIALNAEQTIQLFEVLKAKLGR